MGQQSIRYRILANGRVEEEVIGVQGVACQALTGAIEASLGTVLSSRPTAEAYGHDAVTSLHQQASLKQQSPSGLPTRPVRSLPPSGAHPPALGALSP